MEMENSALELLNRKTCGENKRKDEADGIGGEEEEA